MKTPEEISKELKTSRKNSPKSWAYEETLQRGAPQRHTTKKTLSLGGSRWGGTIRT